MFCNWGRRDRDQHPVNCVSWNQARMYCAWRGARLPTEAEWEYAARGAAGRRLAWGDEAPSSDRANFCGDECQAFVTSLGLTDWNSIAGWRDPFATTAPVGSFPRGNTPEGVADLTGNVWEWVEDDYVPYEPTPGTLARVAHRDTTTLFHPARGGSWDTALPAGVPTFDRVNLINSSRNHLVGFRCAR
jgi:formylglycine-generating enzyme required for sulfatase activity